MLALVTLCLPAMAGELPLAPDSAPEPPVATPPAAPAPDPTPPAEPAPVPPVPTAPVVPMVPAPPAVANPWHPAVPAEGGNPWQEHRGNAAMRIYGASLGAYTGATLGYIAEQDQPATALGLGVALGAGGYGLVWGVERLRPEWDPTIEDVGLFYTSSAIGGFVGIQAARSIVPVGALDETERIAGAGALGSVLGLGVSLAASGKPPPLQTDLALGLGALAGWQGTAGALGLAGFQPPDDRRILAAGELGGAAVLALGGLAYAQAGGPTPSAGQIGLDLGHGMWIGAWTPVIARASDSEAPLDGLRLGVAAGYGLALATAPLGKTSPKSLALQGAGIGIGSSLGAGVPLALGWDPETDPEVVLGPMIAGGVAGQIAGAALAPHYATTPEDGPLVGLLVGWSLYQTVGWSAFGSALTDDGGQSAGFALTSGGATALVGVALVPLVDLGPEEVGMTGTAGLWGTWTGAWGAFLTGAEPETVLASALVGGNAGLLVSGAVLAGQPSVDWWDVALVNGLGATGGATGALFGVIASPTTEVIGGTSLVGSTAGLVAGAYFAGKSPPTHADLLVRIGGGHWRPQVSSRPWIDPDGNQGVWVSLSALETACSKNN